MTERKYTAIVTVSLVSPTGKVLGTETKDVSLKLDMQHFNVAQADSYIADELSTLLAAGAFNIEECFH